MNKIDLTNYRNLIVKIKNLLLSVDEKKWSKKLEEWISEIDKDENPKKEIAEHLRRTRKILGGMGSIGDIVICPESGFNITDDETIINKTNEELMNLIKLLDIEIENILRQINTVL